MPESPVSNAAPLDRQQGHIGQGLPRDKVLRMPRRADPELSKQPPHRLDLRPESRVLGKDADSIGHALRLPITHARHRRDTGNTTSRPFELDDRFHHSAIITGRLLESLKRVYRTRRPTTSACQTGLPCGVIESLMTFPLLTTERLHLRAFRASDAARLQELAALKEVAQGTLRLPHPYPDGTAHAWIADQQREFEAGASINFAIVLKVEEILIGAIGLDFVPEHRHARLGYWLGRPYWNKGYATEAVTAVIEYGFTLPHVQRIYAGLFSDNPASARVLQKAGMTYEGRLREHYVRFGETMDLELYGILRRSSNQGES